MSDSAPSGPSRHCRMPCSASPTGTRNCTSGCSPMPGTTACRTAAARRRRRRGLPVPACGRPMRRYEKAGEPFRENPRCGRPAAHTGVCISAVALARQALRRGARDRDAVLRKAHAHAAALRKAGKPVPLRVRRLDSEYRRRLEGRGDPAPLAPCGTYAAYFLASDIRTRGSLSMMTASGQRERTGRGGSGRGLRQRSPARSVRRDPR